ncbi:serine hydrolase [Pseudoteredinibacter isoporae]|uniref:CubicO group peptidase (Beta-lactamase class C family) n=1 Tax=Pseudoteredinibacter isoporae TaxID=570281 RepID=A0A7X0JX09_9GAMM|nr:serine hydrolase [Pseudoteredinibacter isoporae]MBB6523798.1 CubicO group peptidase (beta-lactamase class C family) [Pseudoteredinibacter isoporae]NHO89318.1 serine hydrolase [Pseudoteredinibacter isoporae]NIB22425.1 serine hydrolase [Pseudoteredinibacter isoporae]
MKTAVSMLLCSVIAFSGQSYSDDEFPLLRGPYMGQKPPGMTAEPFAPGIISKGSWEVEGVFAPGMNEFYFTTDRRGRTRPTVIGFRQEAGVWKKHLEFERRGEIAFSPDGQRMHMAEGYKDRLGHSWSERKSLGPLFDRKDWGIMRLTASEQGTYVFDDYKSKDVIRISRLINGKRQAPKMMGPVVNSGAYTAHPFIAPDESYLIWDSKREGGYGDSDLYISFRRDDGSWGAAINMGESVNSDKWEAYAAVTPDGKYILFNRGVESDNTDIYWVDAKIIDALKSQAESRSGNFPRPPRTVPLATAEEAKLPFREIPLLENAYFSASPQDNNDAVPVGQLGVDGGDRERLLKLAREVAEGQHGKFDSLLIAHKGKLLFESYYRRGRANLPHPQASTTKAYLSLAIGRAIQLGYLSMADLDKPVVSFLDELNPTRFVEGVENITLHSAMTMSSGITISDEQTEAFEKQPAQLKGQGQVQTYLEHSLPINAKTRIFDYKGEDPKLIMQVLNAVVPGTARAFIENELLRKLAIDDYAWSNDDSGFIRGPWGSSMTSRAMIKWGTLVMNRGMWNGEQLIPAAFIDKANSRLVRLAEEDIFFTGSHVSKPGYGYYFWQADMKVGDQYYFTTSGQGGGGQYIIIIEELDLIVVTTTHGRGNKIMHFAATEVLPAFVQ